MQKNKERHIFPGGNTPLGFYSYYSNILDKTKATRIYCLKGGPGMGKSSYMKKLLKAFPNEMSEQLHCSGDPHSLDGVHFPKHGILMVDGTAPHVIDPVYPGAVDEIINLGQFWNVKEIKKHKEDIIYTQHNISYEYSRAYKYLSAAAHIDADTNILYSQATDDAEINKVSEYLCDKIFTQKSTEINPWIRKLFASAITPAGIINYSDTVLEDCERVFALKLGDKVNSFVGADVIMKRIADKARQNGFTAELFYCPMMPDSRIEHIVIPELRAGVTVLNRYNNDETQTTEIVELMQSTNRAMLRENAGKIDENNTMYSELLKKAETAIKDAFWLHNTLESYYVPYMDFDKVNEHCEEIIHEIGKYMQIDEENY